MINIAQPLIGEEEERAVLEVLNSGMLAQGPRVASFEEAFAATIGAKYAIATSSGTTALHTMLLGHDIGPGDEVITSPFSFIASSNSILYTGATPVFVDIDSHTFNIDPGQIIEAITPRTKAILVVHLFGLSCEMDAIIEIAKNHNLLLLEDAAQSHGAKYGEQLVGTFGTGAFSFYPTKNMTSGEGGMITTDDQSIAENCRILRQHGMRRRYYHDDVGYNFRMTDIHAAIGLEQLKKLDKFNAERRRHAGFLNENLMGVSLPIEPEDREHVYHQYTVRVPREHRDKMVQYLRDNGVGCGVYYPIPIHKQKVYIDRGINSSLPQAEKCAFEVLSLPVHPALSASDLDKIVDVVNNYVMEQSLSGGQYDFQREISHG